MLQTAGGLGIFLLGMLIMTEGLRGVAGKSMRAALLRFTSTPASGALSGAIVTAILQSSSATTVATVGFVGAGLMSFKAALGIIFGANIGTTMTGWLVALLGIKLQLGSALLPLVLAGALLRLFGSGRTAAAGFAIAGFGLIFVGLDAMQHGMSGMQAFITPASLPPDSWYGRTLIVLLGMVITMITQSSSAGVATTLTALHSGVISFQQALALVIGMDIGTTITAVLATIGGTTAARRTGLSHLVYNLLTGAGAMLLITPYVMYWQRFLPDALTQQPEIALVAFHTLFNVLGVLLVLPVTGHFARLVKHLVPAADGSYGPEFDRGLLKVPAQALRVTQQSVQILYTQLLRHVDAIVNIGSREQRIDLSQVQTALDETHDYLDGIHLQGSTDSGWERLVALIHALDHMQRLHERCEEDEDRAITARESEILTETHDLLSGLVRANLDGIATNGLASLVRISQQADQEIARLGAARRDLVAASVANGSMSVLQATDCLEAIRWLERVAHHIARIDLHLNNAILASGK